MCQKSATYKRLEYQKALNERSMQDNFSDCKQQMLTQQDLKPSIKRTARQTLLNSEPTN